MSIGKTTMSKKCAALLTLSLMQQSQAEKPIIVWDIHDVLIHRSGVLKTLWNYTDWWKTLQSSSLGLIKDFMSLTAAHVVSGRSSEQFIQTARVHNNPYMEQLIVALTNSQQPIAGMKEITDALHEAGYEQHVASNIGKTPFHLLIDLDQSPHLAPMFIHINIKKSLVVSKENGNFIKKPDPLFFSMYLEKNNLDPHKQPIIFIDDNSKNIASAQGVGIDAILFKNPKQLHKELQKRNLLMHDAE